MDLKNYNTVIFDVTRHPEAFINLLDTQQELPSGLELFPSDIQKNLTFGKIGKQNVIVASTVTTAGYEVEATRLASHFSSWGKILNLRYSVVLGLAGGVFRTTSKDIRLGDVIVSKPKGTHGGVVQYEEQEDGSFKRTGFLDRVPTRLLNTLSGLSAQIELGRVVIEVQNGNYPSADTDFLFDAQYQCVGEGSCNQCDLRELVQREEREDCFPKIHMGGIGSGCTVMGNAKARDSQAKDLKVKCFETNAATLMAMSPSLCVMGIRDYADSHQTSKQYTMWHPYAAAAAAAYTKAFLLAM